MENLKVISFVFCSAYLAILSIMWTSKDVLNQFVKVVIFGSAIFSAILIMGWNIGGTWFDWYFVFPVVLSAIFGSIFLFAESQSSWFTILFKLIGLTSVIMSIVYFKS
jgi:hypothetical protein